MKRISEVESAVNKELHFGKLIHLPIVAWAFDMSRAGVEPIPVAVGAYAKFLKNYSLSASFTLVPANLGFFQMYYAAQLRREHFQKLTPEQRAEITQTAGGFELGIWTPEDSTDWLEEALRFEENFFEELVPLPEEPQENPMDELCDPLHSTRSA